MATASSVITGAGGRIGIDSQPGVGTEVRVSLPAADPLVVGAPDGRAETVFVADDG